MVKELGASLDHSVTDAAEAEETRKGGEAETEAGKTAAGKAEDKTVAMQEEKEGRAKSTERDAASKRLSEAARSRTRGLGRRIGTRVAAGAAAGVLAVGGLSACGTGADNDNDRTYDCVEEGHAPTQAQISYANEHNDGLIPECPDDDDHVHHHSGGGFFYYGSSGHQPSRYADTRAGSGSNWTSWVSSSAAASRGVHGGGSPHVG